MSANLIHFNDESLPLRPGETVAELLHRRGYAPESVATALNGTFLPRPEREHTLLQPNDRVTAFQAIVGG